MYSEDESFELGAEDMELRAMRMEAERNWELEAAMDLEELDLLFTVICLECGVVGENPDECEGCGGTDLELA